MILSKFVEFIQLFSTRAVPARPVRRVKLYVLQTHQPDYLLFHIRFNKSFAFGERVETFYASPVNPPVSPNGAFGASKAAFWPRQFGAARPSLPQKLQTHLVRARSQNILFFQ